MKNIQIVKWKKRDDVLLNVIMCNACMWIHFKKMNEAIGAFYDEKRVPLGAMKMLIVLYQFWILQAFYSTRFGSKRISNQANSIQPVHSIDIYSFWALFKINDDLLVLDLLWSS